MNEPHDPLTEFEDRWREWASTRARIDEDQLRAALPVRLPFPRRSRVRAVVLAVAAGLVLAMIGVGSLYLMRGPASRQPPLERPKIVHRLDNNVVLLIAKDSAPVYVVLTRVPARKEGS